MAQWAATWTCMCGQQNWLKVTHCSKCNMNWKASSGQESNGKPDRRRQRSNSQKSIDSRPWGDDVEEEIKGPPFVRMAIPAEAQANPNCKPLSPKADESETKTYYRETRSKLNLPQQRCNIAWAMKEPVQDIVDQIAVLRRMLIPEKSLEQQGAWTETTIERMMLRVDAGNKAVEIQQGILDRKVSMRDNLQDQLE
ncbi:unnamed protein product, partial [Prorocentrum cordatum]